MKKSFSTTFHVRMRKDRYALLDILVTLLPAYLDKLGVKYPIENQDNYRWPMNSAVTISSRSKPPTMKPAARFFAVLVPALTLVLALLAPCLALATPSAIYLVRHGEKAPGDGKDPELTEIGRVRARNLAAMLGKAGIEAVFSTPSARTRQTAAPLAAAGGLAVQAYNPKAPGALVAKVKALSGAVLVVGHSNTLTELVRLFGGVPGPDIADNEYDRLYQLTVGADGSIATVLLTSLPVTGAVP